MFQKLILKDRNIYFEKIRDFSQEDSKDTLCPDPTKNMFASSQATLNTTTRQTERVRKIGVCSICHTTGKTIANKTKCPQNK